MKTIEVAILAGAIALVLAGFGFGIAQAGNHSERPVLSFQDLEAGSSNPYAESRPVLSFADEEAYRLAKSPSKDMQLQGPFETGSLPFGSDAKSSLLEAGGLQYRVEIDTGP